ncbi:MAG: YciI family protein [Myxococcales bacterium]|nr:YciI family protein [Myxococcales bacterium]
MLYALLCYNSEDVVWTASQAEDDALMARLSEVHQRWEQAGKLKPAIRLLPTTSATTLRKADGLVLDGPYAETKEQLLGFYIVDVESLEEGLQFARELCAVNPGGAYELRPVALYVPGGPVAPEHAVGTGR